MSSFVFWSLLLSLVGGLVVQWVAMRATHHRRLQELQAEHHQVLVRLRNDLEAVTRRMHQSERDRDLAVAAQKSLQQPTSRFKVAPDFAKFARDEGIELSKSAQAGAWSKWPRIPRDRRGLTGGRKHYGAAARCLE